MAKITILGAGNSGTAHAWYLTGLGHEVSLLKTSRAMHDENFEEIRRAGGVRGVMSIDGATEPEFRPLKRITRDVAEALSDAEVIMVLTQSLQHQNIARLIAPHIGPDLKAVVLTPGNLGSVYFRQIVSPDVLLAEGESTIIDARLTGRPGEVDINFRNVRNSISFLPASDAGRGFEYLHKLIPNYTGTRKNVIETALHNPNLVIHTIGTIMSASMIENHSKEFCMYRHAFSPGIWRLVDALDAEKNAVIEAYGGDGMAYLDCCKFRNEEDITKDSLEVFKGYASVAAMGPDSLRSRYIHEDVPNGLVLLSTLGAIAGISTPVADSLINIASALTGVDFRSTGRTAEKLGFPSSSQSDIIAYISGTI